MKSNRKKLILLVVLLICLALMISVAVLLSSLLESDWENGEDTDSETLNIEELLGAREIDGETYYPKRGVRNYLIMGVDEFGDASSGARGQSDFIMILSFDSYAKSYDMITINRDTVVDVDYYDIFGNYGGVRREQIALSHAYGMLGEISNPKKCLNTQKSVSGLFGGLDFKGYISLTMDAVCIMVDHLGGVDVLIEDDLTGVDPRLIKGETVLMDGELALKFVRARGGLDDSSNIARMKRQEAFLERFFEKLGADGEDEASMLRCYEAVESKLVSNIGEEGYSEMVSMLSTYEKRSALSPDGEAMVGKQGYMEFYADKESIKKILTGVFYEKADK